MATLLEAFSQALSHHQTGRLDKAESLYRQILAADARHAESWHLLGVAAFQRGCAEEAVALIGRAVRLKDDTPLFHLNLGKAYAETGHAEAAAGHFRRVLALRPDHAEAHFRLGNMLVELGRLEAAAMHLEHTLAAQPDFAAAHNNLGNVRMSQGRLEEAVTCYEQAQAARPDYAEAHGNRANALRVLGRHAEALEAAGRCLALGRRAMALNAMANIYNALGDSPQSLACYRAILEDGPDPVIHSRLLMSMQYCDTVSEADIFAEARAWAASHTAGITPYTVWPAVMFEPERQLKVGLVSFDFRLCSTPWLALPLFRNWPPDWSVSFYSTVLKPDPWTERCRDLCERWVDIAGLDDDQAAARIKDDGIDVLIDLNGHTVGGRPGVFARKPAPVQVAWLDYVGTTGLATVDAIIADGGHLPLADQHWYIEPIRHVTGNLYRYTPPERAPGVAPLPAVANGFISFGCFNAPYKLSATTLGLWARVLDAVPGSRLILNSREFQSADTRNRLLGLLSGLGTAPGRITFRPGAAEPAEMLATYGEIDVALDPMPYSGGLTTLEGLYMGVPVVTLPGRRFGSRHSAVHLRTVGLDDWIAADPAGYVALAAEKAGNLEALAAQRTSLRGRLMASPLTDGAALARDFSRIVRELWREACTTPP